MKTAAYYRSLKTLDTIENVLVDILESFNVVKTIVTSGVAPANIQTTMDGITANAVLNSWQIIDMSLMLAAGGASYIIVTQYCKYQ